MEKKARTVQDLNEKLWNVIEGLENKTLKVSEAKETTNACGKIIQAALAQLQANAMGASVSVDLLDIPEGAIQMNTGKAQKKLRQLS